jgi:hypothetical protein
MKTVQVKFSGPPGLPLQYGVTASESEPRPAATGHRDVHKSLPHESRRSRVAPAALRPQYNFKLNALSAGPRAASDCGSLTVTGNSPAREPQPDSPLAEARSHGATDGTMPAPGPGAGGPGPGLV